MAHQTLTQLISVSTKFKSPITKLFKHNPVNHYAVTPPASWVPKHKLVMPNQIIGVEVEIENITQTTPPSVSNYWSVTEDGSLRNNGAEFISAPMAGNHALYALDCLYKHLNKIGATCSPRTSVHVHVNMQPYTMEQLWNILMLYIVFERVLYDFVGNERERNNFCIPLYAYPKTFDFLSQFLSNPQSAAIYWLKYTGLNLKPLQNTNQKAGYGTIEFRHFSGSKDIDLVVLWINLILSIVKTAVETKYEDLERTINTASVDFLTELVFKEYAGVFSTKPLQVMISEGMRDLKLFKTILGDTPEYKSNSDLHKALNT